VITNERQYRITKSEARKFEQAIAVARGRDRSPDVDPRLHQAMIESLESELAIVCDDLDRYEALKGGKVKKRRIHSLRELPVLFIEGRIAAGLTQRELAERLGLPEQQIQRYESNMYSGVSLDRLQGLADALGLEIKERHVRCIREVTDAEAFEYYEDTSRREPAPGQPRHSSERPLTQNVPVRFSSEAIKRVKSVANAEGVTASVWIRRVVDEELRQQLGDGPPDSHR
jgi:transcriptional regulator with XRE-family HTH domain